MPSRRKQCPLCENYMDAKSKRCRSCLYKIGYRTYCGYQHGEYGTMIHKKWKMMREQCRYNRTPLQESWKVYQNFRDDMGMCGPDDLLVRIDKKKGFTKENCKWKKKRRAK